MPAIVLRLAPHDHTAVLSMLATFVYVAVAVVPPVSGWLSDRALKRGGDRRRETALLLLVDVLAIGAMAFAASVGAVAVALVAATVAITAAQTIYQALLPEVVPRAAWGTSSGARGVMTLAGTVLGLLAAALLAPQLALLGDGRRDGRCPRSRSRRSRGPPPAGRTAARRAARDRFATATISS